MRTAAISKILIALGAFALFGGCSVLERNAACGSTGSRSQCESYHYEQNRQEAIRQEQRDQNYRRAQAAKKFEERSARKAKRDKEEAKKFIEDLQKQKIPTAAEMRKAVQEVNAECRKKAPCRHYAAGKRHYNAKRYRQSIGEFAKSVRADRNYDIAHVMWGMALTRTGKAPEAVRRIDSGIAAARRIGKSRGWYWWPYYHKGVALMVSRKPVAARAAFSESIRLNPQSDTYVGRGRAYASERKFVQAIADFDRALKKNARNASAWSSKARVHFMARSFSPGCKAAKKACSLGDCQILKKVPQCGR